MGLFSSKKIITVSSTLYNMAGPEEDRANYLKGTLFASVMKNSPSLADDITSSYFTGPGLKQRQFFKYADRNDIAGLPTVTVTNSSVVDPDIVGLSIPIPATPAGMENVVQNAEITDGDPEPFFERWVLENHPDRNSEDWLGEIDHLTGTFLIQFPNGDYFSFEDPSYSTDKRYIVASYFQILDDNTQPLQEGTPTTVTSQKDLTDYETVSQSGNFENVTLIRTDDVTEEWNDGTPTNNYQQNADLATTLNRSVDVYENTELVDVIGFQTEGLFTRLTYTGADVVGSGYSNTVVTTENFPGGVVKTTTTVTTGEQIVETWTEKEDTQQILESTVINNEQKFIYEIGSGDAALDALATEADASNFQEFYPFLPLRLNNKSLSHEKYGSEDYEVTTGSGSVFDPIVTETKTGNGLYEETKKAYRRATNLANIDDILAEIEDNPSIDDIDYAYIMYGVSLNVQDQSCRKYVFKFMEKMLQFQNSTQADIASFQNSISDYTTALGELQTWEETDWENTPWETRPERPALPNLKIPDVSTIRLKTDSPLMPSFDIRLQWHHIEVDQVSGVYEYTPVIGDPRPAKKDELQFVKGPTVTWQERVGGVPQTISEAISFITGYIDKSMESMIMYWQISDTEYRRITVYGMKHYNYIYGGKSVKINTDEALDDSDISGFVIPLHYPTVRELSIVDYTQMATANVHVLFNSYTVTKQKWYERGIFKILLIIVILVVAVIISPGAFAAGSGILGGNVAIGAALGLTGTAAIVAGVVANYLASIVISQLLTIVGTELFGEKWGALFASLASLAFGAAMTGMDLFSAQGILSLGNALANGYAGYVQGDIAEMNEFLQEESDEYEKQMDYINDLIAGLGGNDLNFDPLSLTDSVYGNGSGARSGGYTPETADEFIRRTTMVGSDIVEITQSMVYDYVDVAQTLPKN